MNNKKLRIAQIAPFEESVPPAKYGGTELVIANLTESLVKLGHEVTLLASGDSVSEAKLVPIFPQAIRTDKKIGTNLQKREAAKFIGLARVVDFLQHNHFDIIHNHLGWRLLAFLKLLKSPVVTTLHGPLNVDYQRFVYRQFTQVNYVSISDSQRRAFPQLNFIATVYNGIQVDKFQFNAKPGKYLAFLGRMSPEKGPLQSILAAKKAKIPLVMAAKIDLVDRPYFNQKIKPLIDGRRIKFIGEVNHQGKVKLLKDALALLALIQWEEPFGLFMTEAMACGTPVIAMRRGSVPEIIKDNQTGFIVQNINQAAAAIKKIVRINRLTCRQEVERHFSADIMAGNYEKIYYSLIRKNHR